MYNEWGYNGKYKRTFDAKIGIRIKSKISGEYYTAADMINFVLKLYIAGRESVKVTASCEDLTPTGCVIQEDGLIIINIPANTFQAGYVVLAYEPEITDVTFVDGKYQPSIGKLLGKQFID
jgi:hypothetical protein